MSVNIHVHCMSVPAAFAAAAGDVMWMWMWMLMGLMSKMKGEWQLRAQMLDMMCMHYSYKLTLLVKELIHKSLVTGVISLISFVCRAWLLLMKMTMMMMRLQKWMAKGVSFQWRVALSELESM